MILRICNDLEELRTRRPLVHNITNYVVMNFTANVLLALGASPVMAHALEEVQEMTELSSSLVLNLGTLSSPWIESMMRAAETASDRSIPLVLDPVGAGATKLRTTTARTILSHARVTIVRGNPSEILAVAGERAETRGVESQQRLEAAQEAAVFLAGKHGTVVAVTGPRDFVTDGQRGVEVGNGHPLLQRVTGTGCAASAVTAAFAAVEKDSLTAAVGALVVFGIAGELAARSNPRPGTFQTLLLDALDEVTSAHIREGARLVIS